MPVATSLWVRVGDSRALAPGDRTFPWRPHHDRRQPVEACPSSADTRTTGAETPGQGRSDRFRRAEQEEMCLVVQGKALQVGEMVTKTLLPGLAPRRGSHIQQAPPATVRNRIEPGGWSQFLQGVADME